MKKVITLAALLVAFGASSALAQSGVNLGWDDCATGTPAGDKVFACNVNTGAAFTLHASVVIPAAMTAFAATNTIIDVHVNDVALPAWWQTDVGQCRANSIGMSFDPNNNSTSCVDLWGGNPNLQVTAIQQGVNGPNRVRVNGVAAIPAGSEIAVPADNADLWVCRVTINRAASTTCAGCTFGGCIVLNEVSLLQPDIPGMYVTNEATKRWVTWQGGGGTDCPADTPTQNRTWGAVKNMYR
jgi:hypothetical protein